MHQSFPLIQHIMNHYSMRIVSISTVFQCAWLLPINSCICMDALEAASMKNDFSGPLESLSILMHKTDYIYKI